MKPSRVVIRMRRAESPSTPKKYETPMEGIHSWRSTYWKPSAWRSNANHRGRLTRKPRRPTAFANHRTPLSLLRKTGSRSRSAPASGV